MQERSFFPRVRAPAHMVTKPTKTCKTWNKLWAEEGWCVSPTTMQVTPLGTVISPLICLCAKQTFQTPPRLILLNSSTISLAVPHDSPAPAAGDWEDASKDFHHNSIHWAAVLLNEFRSKTNAVTHSVVRWNYHVLHTCTAPRWCPGSSARKALCFTWTFLGTGHRIASLLFTLKIPKESSGLVAFPRQWREVLTFHSSCRGC